MLIEVMGEQATPGIHNRTPLEKRVTKLERILMPFRRQKITAKTLTGEPATFDTLATQPIPAKPEGSFICTYSDDKMKVSGGSYQYPIGTNVDVEKSEGTGKYAYAIIQQLAGGGLNKFSIEITNDTKDPTNLDVGGTFVEFSNVLLAEVVGSGGDSKLVQRRVGNLSLIYRLINGSFCLWPETTGGTSL